MRRPTRLTPGTSKRRWTDFLISVWSRALVPRAWMKKKKYLVETSAVPVAIGGSTAAHRDEFQRTVADGASMYSLYKGGGAGIGGAPGRPE